MCNFILDLLLPQKPLVRELLKMTPTEFAERARRADGRTGKEILSLFDYREPLVKEAVWMLKYRGNKTIATLLSALLYDELLSFLEEYAPLRNFTNPLLIPIPLSKKRLRERGFNQCELLTNGLEKLDGGRNFSLSTTALQKVKETPSQTKIESRAEREKNLKNCFSASDKAAGRNIILIDDVSTTGATLEEARRTLLRAGARKVIAFTFAH